MADVTGWIRLTPETLPERGMVVSTVRYPEQGHVRIMERMRVEIVFADPPGIYGPGLPFVQTVHDDLPGRPDDEPFGTVTFWREVE